MSETANTVDNLTVGDYVYIQTSDGGNYEGRICETQRRESNQHPIGEGKEKEFPNFEDKTHQLVMSRPQSILSVYHTGTNQSDYVKLWLENGVHFDVEEVRIKNKN